MDTVKLRWSSGYSSAVVFEAGLQSEAIATAMASALLTFRWQTVVVKQGVRSYSAAQLQLFHAERWLHWKEIGSVRGVEFGESVRVGVPERSVRGADPRWSIAAGRVNDPNHPHWRELVAEDNPEDSAWCWDNAGRVLELLRQTWSWCDALDGLGIQVASTLPIGSRK